jgi:hypothetical protein
MPFELKISPVLATRVGEIIGLLAAAMAELTDGFIFSDDGAWPGPPIRSDEFELHYFKPTQAKTYADASWYSRCLESLINDYQGKLNVSEVGLIIEHEWPLHQRVRYAPSNRLFQEGPNEDDRLIILHSRYFNFPYLVIKRTLIKADEQLLIRKMMFLDIQSDFGRQLMNRIYEFDIQPMVANKKFTFWLNPGLDKRSEAILSDLID